MEQSYMSVFFGAIIGAVVCILTMLTVNFLKKQSAGKDTANKESIMHLIGELCAEIDSLITSNKEGILNNAGIQTALRKKNDEIVRLIKPNMHILDVYFVKYMDYVQKEYQKYLTSSHTDPEVSSLQSKSVAFSFESKAEQPKAEVQATSVRSGSIEQDLHALEKAFFKEPVKDTRKKTLETIFSPVKEEIKEDSKDTLKSADFSIKPAAPATGAERSFFSDDESADEYFESAPSKPAVQDTPVAAVETPKIAPELANNDSVSEEDFTMETIMDLDISKLNIHRSTPLHDFSKKIEPKQPVASNTVQKSVPKEEPKAAPVAETKTPVEQESISQPKPLSLLAEEKIEGPINSVSAPHAADLKPKPVLPKKHSEVAAAPAQSTSKKDISITGDDVADKIDAFFGIDK